MEDFADLDTGYGNFWEPYTSLRLFGGSRKGLTDVLRTTKKVYGVFVANYGLWVFEERLSGVQKQELGTLGVVRHVCGVLRYLARV